MKAFWELATTRDKIPLPERFLSSPLTRCLQTAILSTRGLAKKVNVEVSEGLREVYGIHTCDRTKSRIDIQSTFPSVEFETGFPPSDNLWLPDKRESHDHATERLRAWLARRFLSEENAFISATTHSGAIRALYRATGHPDIWVARGSVTPLLVRAKRLGT